MALVDNIRNASITEALLWIIVPIVLYNIALVTFRVYFSQLVAFPGPKLAAATLWYEFYYDVIRRGKFAWEIKRMHEVYGPVVRINPNELHVSDPNFYDELYTGQSRRRHKFEWSADMFLCPGAMISTIDHDLHRKRRAPLAPYFSMSAIRRFDPVIRQKLELLSRRFDEFRSSGRPITLDHAFSSLTTDIISQYSFGISHGFLEAEDFNPDWLMLLKGASEQSLLTKQMPWLIKTMRRIPLTWLVNVKPEMANLVRFQTGVKECLEEVTSGRIEPTEENQHLTVFHGLLQCGLPKSELTPRRLQGEGETLVAAGTLTTAHYLKSTVYHILANQDIFQKLNEELKVVMPNAAQIPALNSLEQLPYLNAVVNEGFRLSHGVIARLTRVAPDEALRVAGYTIPANTPVGMSSWLLHLNPDIFPNPEKFQPERWFAPGAQQRRKYLVNFTRGSRMCLGKELARVEILYTIALVVRRWSGEGGGGRMELFQTERVDADIEHDFFNPFQALEVKVSGWFWCEGGSGVTNQPEKHLGSLGWLRERNSS